MPKKISKTSSKIKGLFRPIHLQAILFLLAYNIVSKSIFVKAVIIESNFVNFFVPYVFGILSGWMFLYLLKHEDFFHFMREVEKEEKGREKKLLSKYIHHGKVFATLIIAAVAGPIFGALTIRLILPKYKYGIVLIAIGNIFSTLISVAMAKGVLGLM